MILPGVTRDPVLALTREHATGKTQLAGLPAKLVVNERMMFMKEIVEFTHDGSLVEMFGTGTAAVVSAVNRVECLGDDIVVPVEDSGMGVVCATMLREIVGRQRGEIPSEWDVATMLLAGLLTLFALATPALTASHRSPVSRRSLGRRDLYPDSLPVSGDITGIADTSVIKTPEGLYLLYSTGVGIPIYMSADRLVWTAIGKTFADLPSAAAPFTGSGDLWAPDVVFVHGKYLMYYSSSSGGSQNSAIFLAESPTGQPETWINKGMVISTKPGDTFNAIDPHFSVHPNGDWSLILGSSWSGIQQLRLDSATGLRADSKITNISGRPDGAGNEEGSWLYFDPSNKAYFLFTSFDACCHGTASTYNVRVSRSETFDGPFVDKAGIAALEGGGTEILGSHGKFFGPGGNSILVDDDGPIIFYHYFSATTSILGVNVLDFSSGWPRLK